MSQVLRLGIKTGSRLNIRRVDGLLHESELAANRDVVLRDALRDLLQRFLVSQPEGPEHPMTFMLHVEDFHVDGTDQTLIADALLALFSFYEGPVGQCILEKRIRLSLEVPHATQEAVDKAISIISTWSAFLHGVWLVLPFDVEWQYDSQPDEPAIGLEQAPWELILKVPNPPSPGDNWHVFPDLKGNWLPVTNIINLMLDNVVLPGMHDIGHPKLPQLPNVVTFAYIISHRLQMSGLRAIVAFCFPCLKEVTIELRGVPPRTDDTDADGNDGERCKDRQLSVNQRAMNFVFAQRYKVKVLHILFPPGAALHTAVSIDEVKDELAPDWLEGVKIHCRAKIDPDAVQLPFVELGHVEPESSDT